MSLLQTVSESTNWLTAALALAVCLAVYVYFQWTQLPPGPTGIPYLGYYPYLTKDCHVQLFEMSKKYGKVFCFRYTGQLYAHIMELKTIREVTLTKSDCFDARPSTFTLFKDLLENSVFLLNGEGWKVLKKFFVQQFKELGMGKNAQEGVMLGCLKKIVSCLRESGGKTLDGLQLFTDISNDVIHHMLFGGVTLDDKDVRDFHLAFKIVTDFITGERILLAGPFLKYILLPFGSEFRKYRKYRDQAASITTKIIRQHEREFDRNNIRNLIDSCINQRKLLEEENDPRSKFFTERYLAPTFLQFFGDGALSVAWLVAGLLKTIASYPVVQKAVQTEVDEVVGRNRFPSADDRSRLHYTNATIYEGLRTTVFLPLFPTIECTKETTVGGCRIPKGTIPVYNLWATFRDPQVYPEPNKFDPTRFLSVDGKKPKSEIPILFGVGKRSCAGESFSIMEIMLYVTTVLQNFDLHPADENEGKIEEWNISFRATPRAS